MEGGKDIRMRGREDEERRTGRQEEDELTLAIISEHSKTLFLNSPDVLWLSATTGQEGEPRSRQATDAAPWQVLPRSRRHSHSRLRGRGVQGERAAVSSPAG
eukprot:755029-Hanusia_phi.AAC.17